MIEMAQSQLMTLIAGAVLTSALLGFAASESAQAADAEALAAIDGLARTIASTACDARHPSTTLPLLSTLQDLPPKVASLRLFPTHLRAVFADGHALSSIEFPAVPLLEPPTLNGASSLTFSWDGLFQTCQVAVS